MSTFGAISKQSFKRTITRTVHINGWKLYYCLECIKPHIVQLCNGTTEPEYKTCNFHAELETQFPDTSLRPLPSLNIGHFDEIREHLGTERLAMYLYLNWPESHIESTLEQHNNGRRVSSEIVQRAMEVMMKPEKRSHANGCLHSGNPQVIVCNTEKDGGDSESRMASGLYFRRCDGEFKNIKGEVIRSDGRNK